MSDTVLVTGGAGYIGASLCQELLTSGRRIKVLDALAHRQEHVARELERAGVALIRGDIRDADARRGALAGGDVVVHLAAVVGDPACARDPEGSPAINLEATRALIDDACAAGVGHMVFASTCSNYGRMVEFTRDLWAGRRLEVFGERFWRPYVHVRDVARAVQTVLDAPPARVDGEVFNVGCSSENYRKLDLVRVIGEQLDTGGVSYVQREEDPRDYRVSFEKIRRELGFEVTMTAADGVREVVQALSSGAIPDPYDAAHRNLA